MDHFQIDVFLGPVTGRSRVSGPDIFGPNRGPDF